MSCHRIATVLPLVAVLATATLPSRNAEAVTVTQIVTGLKKAYDAYKKYRGGQYTLKQATADVLAGIDEAKAEILAQIDGIAAAEGRACAQGIILNAGDMDAVSQQVREQLAFDGVYCLSLIESLLATVDDEAAVDKLGFALNALGPVVMMARAQAGLSESPGVVDWLVNGNLAVDAKLYPQCMVMTLNGDSDGSFIEQNIRCTAYNGDLGFGFSWVGDPAQDSKKEKAADQATRNTSRAVGQELIPVITAPPPEPPPPPTPQLPTRPSLPPMKAWVF